MGWLIKRMQIYIYIVMASKAAIDDKFGYKKIPENMDVDGLQSCLFLQISFSTYRHKRENKKLSNSSSLFDIWFQSQQLSYAKMFDTF
jgi:hypothetical protein